MRRRIVLLTLITVTVVAAPVSIRHTRRQVRNLRRQVERRRRYLQGVSKGWRYWRLGGHPAWNVSDAVLLNRIRSELGPLEKHLDIPRVKVMVEDKVATLHGDVLSQDQVEALVRAAEAVSGVQGVRSELHVGLAAGETRPSEGRTHRPPSPAFEWLVSAARRGGQSEARAVAGVEAVLSSLADRLPPDERAHLLSHLPADVRALVLPPDEPSRGRIRHVEEFVEIVARMGSLDPGAARTLIGSVIPVVKELVPEEVADISAVLPAELRELWDAPQTV